MTSVAPPLSTHCWTRVCSSDRLVSDRPVCALLDDVPIGIVRTSFGELFGFVSIDPFSSANVLWRGVVGSIAGRPTISSPMFKQRFLLETGVCLDDASHSIEVVMVREQNGGIEVRRA